MGVPLVPNVPAFFMNIMKLPKFTKAHQLLEPTFNSIWLHKSLIKWLCNHQLYGSIGINQTEKMIE